jgi:tellurite methyltransferase
LTAVDRTITGFHQDSEGHWVAELACGHDQHVRHRPPFQDRAWVIDDVRRAARVGSPLECPLCDRAELPQAVRLIRTSPEWTERTLPPGLRRAHRVAAATWGRIRVREGALRFRRAGEPPLESELGPGSEQAIPPDMEHDVSPVGSVRFSIDFLAVDRRPSASVGADEGGDPACWAGLLCAECGAVLDGGAHRAGCPDEGSG